MELDWSGRRLNSLAAKMKKGNRQAAAAIYDELASKVFGFCFSRVGKRALAEDLTQDIFLKLLDKVQTFDEGKGNFAVWFWRLARNTVIDYYREKKSLSFSDFGEEIESVAYAEPTASLDAKLAYEGLNNFLNSLSGEEKQLFELRYIAELSYKEIAGITEKSEVLLRVNMSRLKKKLKDNLKK